MLHFEKSANTDHQYIEFNIKNLRKAIGEEKKVSFTYNSAVGNHKTHTIIPYSFAYEIGKYYIIGYLESKDCLLHFRIDRISDVKILKEDGKLIEEIEDGALVKCKDLTNNAEIDFEPMFSFVREYWEIDDSISIIKELGYIEEFLNIIFMDALCYNIDRHTFNFGILRRDGEPVGLAPNFDNNLGLSGVLNNKGLENTWYSTAFTKNNYKPILEEYDYHIPKIDLEEIKKIINDTLKDFPILRSEAGFGDSVFKIIKNNYEELLK